MFDTRANFKTSPFASRPLAGRQTQILILETLNVFLWLKLSSSLILNPAVSGKRFETASFFFNLPFFLIYPGCSVQKKSPDRNESIRGFPFFILKILWLPLCPRRSCLAVQAGLLTFPPFQRPSHSQIGTVAHKAERVPLSIWKGRDYSDGLVPDFHEVPY